MDTGAKLQQARIGRGLTLADISRATKMSSHVLESIERSEFDQLPGGLLTRGHLRAFASEVGLDPETIVSEYRSEYESATDGDDLMKLRTSYQDRDIRVPYAGMIVMFALAVFVFFAVSRSTEQPDSIESAAEVAEVGIEDAATISNAVADTPQSAPLGIPVPLTPVSTEGLRIELRPQAECWVSAVADGRLVIYRLMQAGERATIDARDDLQLRVGDAGALTYFVNGTAGRPLGASGEAVTVRMTSDDAATWVKKDPPQVVGI